MKTRFSLAVAIWLVAVSCSKKPEENASTAKPAVEGGGKLMSAGFELGDDFSVAVGTETGAASAGSSNQGGPRFDSDGEGEEPEWKKNGEVPPDDLMIKAVVAGDLLALEEYIDAGGNVNATTESGSSLLNNTVVFSRPEAFAVLIEAGADVSQTDPKGYAALHSAVFFGETEIVRGLLEAGADPYQKSNEGHVPFGAIRATMEQMKPHYDRIGAQLEANNGILLDMEKIRASRGPISQLLEETGAP